MRLTFPWGPRRGSSTELEVGTTPCDYLRRHSGCHRPRYSDSCLLAATLRKTKCDVSAGHQSWMVSVPARSRSDVVPLTPARASSVAPSADRKSTRLNSSHLVISYAVFCLKKKKKRHGYTSQCRSG